MKSVSALKLVDRAILPGVIVISTKILGIFLASLIFQIPWTISLEPTGSNFLIFSFSSSEALSTVTNFSDLVTILVCGLAFTWTIFQAQHLNIDFTHPTLISKLIKKGKDFWLTTTGQVYHQAAVWLLLTWVVFFLIIINVYQGLTSSFVLGVSLTITLGLTFVFYKFAKDT
ncbi:MAG TPA: hypothetical protein VLE47_04045 [Candidatus Saccharimonadales bacterium]|nr:hypothetical protein [Candidatus Saccharimonadales bacterium]